MQTREWSGRFSNVFLAIGVNKQNAAIKLVEIQLFNLLFSYGLY